MATKSNGFILQESLKHLLSRIKHIHQSVNDRGDLYMAYIMRNNGNNVNGRGDLYITLSEVYGSGNGVDN